MLDTALDIVKEVLVRLGTSTTTSITGYTDTIMSSWLNKSNRWAAGYHKWPFVEGRSSTTYTSSTEEWEYPEGWKSDSISRLTIGGYRLEKKDFESYNIYREEESDGTDRIFSDYGRIYYVNPNTALTGTMWVYGQYTPMVIDITSGDNTTTAFSYAEEEGNEAIMHEMLSYAKSRERKPQESMVEHQMAIQTLDNIWKRIMDEQYAYQSKSRGMFKYFDVLQGGDGPIIDEDQF